MPVASPMNLRRWVNDHRDKLKPPVGNQCMYDEGDFIIMIVGGPNARRDYHINTTEEFFYQIEGDMNLRILENGKPRDVVIREGDVFMLPANIPHSPQRPAGTVGMVVERKRPEGAVDMLRFNCEKCGAVLHEDTFELENIVTQLKAAMEKFWSNDDLRTCKKCGAKLEKPAGPIMPTD